MADISKVDSLDGLTTYNIKDAAARALLDGHSVGKDVPSDAVFTDTTYSSKTAASGGTDVSLVTTGEKYTWNNKGTYSKPSGGIPKTDLASDVKTSLGKADTALQTHQDISGKMNASLKGAANGVAELDSSGKVPSSQLPSYVDDVLEYNNKASFPTTGETGKIYIDKATNLTWRWSGTAYVEISPSLALGTTSSTAFRGDYGSSAYSHAVTNKGSAFSSGLYKITTNSEGHVTAAIAVAKSDITGLGIPGSDTNTHRPIQVNGTEVLGNNTRALNLKAGSNVSVTNSSGTVTIAATDTTYSSKTAASGGTDVSLVTTGEKYTWNNKGTYSKPSGGIPDSDIASAATWNAKASTAVATTSADGLMSSGDKTKLNGIASGAEVNQNAFSNVVVGSTTIAADGKTDTLTLVAGSNVTLTPDATNDKVTIAATDTTYSSKTAASGGTDVSLVTTGEKYTWNNKGNGTITGIKMNGSSKGSSGVVDLGTIITAHQDISGKMDSSLKGAANGVAELDSTGKVPSSQLPSYVDDVLEYDSQSTFPTIGEAGKIYVAKDTNKTYRWSGIAYVEISPSLALGETSSTAYRGDRGKTAYDHSQSTHARTDATAVEASSTNGNIKINGTETTVYTHPGSGTNPHGTTKSDVGLGNVGNFKAVSTAASQGLTDTEKSNARANIGAGTSSLALGTSSSTAYRGDRGNSAYAHAVTNKGSAFASGLYKITTNSEGHVTAATAVEKADITGLGIPGSDTNTHRPIQVNGTEVLGNNTTALNLKAGSNVSVTNSSGTVTIAATDTTYSSKTAASGGTDVSLVTTGEKYTWNNKGSYSKPSGGIPDSDIASASTWNAKGTYSKPSGGIPKTDLASAVQTSLGKADSALQSHQTIKQDGVTGATVNRFGTCSTAAGTAAKVVSITTGTFSLEVGAMVAVKFSNKNTAERPTLNVNSSGAKNIFVNGAQITTGGNKALLAGTVIFLYDGAQWHLIGNYYDTNTTYSVATESENGLMSAADKTKLDTLASFVGITLTTIKTIVVNK